MELSPYDILGISPTNDKYVISGAYKRMILLVHPDKAKSNGLNWTHEQCNEAFNNIRKAYKTLVRDYDFKDMPDYDINYDERTVDKIDNTNYLDSKDSKDFDTTFNSNFKSKKEYDASQGYADPSDVGYSDFNRSKNLDDVKEQLSKEYKPLNKHKYNFSTEIVKHDVGTIVSGNDNLYEFGLTKIDNFSISNSSSSKNSLNGSDLLDSHKDSEHWGDVVARNTELYNKYNNNSGNLKNDVEDRLSERNIFDSNIKYSEDDKLKFDDTNNKRAKVQKGRDKYHGIGMIK
jgi:hypothetical protein